MSFSAEVDGRQVTAAVTFDRPAAGGPVDLGPVELSEPTVSSEPFTNLEIPLPFDAQSTALGSFDGDAFLDVAVSVGRNMLLVFPGDGDGGFGAAIPSDYSIGSAEHLVAGDLDGDGNLDLVLEHGSIDDIEWLFGNGDGTFGDSMTASPTDTGSLELVDLDADGRLDVVWRSDRGTQFIVYFNDGARAFTPFAFEPNEILFQTLVHAGDVDGDGNPDLVFGPGEVVTLYGDGAGGFEDPVVHPTRLSMGNFVLADVTDDGLPDIVGNNIETAAEMINTGGGFADPVRYPTKGTSAPAVPFGLLVEDFDGDGHRDIASLVSGAEICDGFGLLTNAEDGTFGEARVVCAAQLPGRPSALDIDTDGDLDIVADGNESLVLVENAGGGDFRTFDAYPHGARSGASALAIGDVDDDGVPDAVVGSTSGSRLALLPGDGRIRRSRRLALAARAARDGPRPRRRRQRS